MCLVIRASFLKLKVPDRKFWEETIEWCDGEEGSGALHHFHLGQTFMENLLKTSTVQPP